MRPSLKRSAKSLRTCFPVPASVTICPLASLGNHLSRDPLGNHNIWQKFWRGDLWQLVGQLADNLACAGGAGTTSGIKPDRRFWPLLNDPEMAEKLAANSSWHKFKLAQRHVFHKFYHLFEHVVYSFFQPSGPRFTTIWAAFWLHFGFIWGLRELPGALPGLPYNQDP